MKRYLLVFSFIIVSFPLLAQQWQLGISYKYLYSGQWDKCIQTYNFSRPFLNEKQPLIINGINPNLSYLFKNTKKIKYGIDVSYSYFGSKATNENYTNKLNLHLLNIGYMMSYQNPEKLKHLTFDLSVSALLGGLFRKVNKERFEYDDKKIKSLGIGGNLNLKMNYLIKLTDKYILAPHISIGYAPYYFNPKTEEVINQTTELISKNWTGIITSQVGVSIYLNKF